MRPMTVSSFITIPDNNSATVKAHENNTTTNLIDEMEMVAESIDNEYNEIMDDFGTSSVQTPDQYWDKQQENFDAHVELRSKELNVKYKSTHALHSANITELIDIELIRLRELFNTTTINSVAALKAANTSQQKILQDSAAEIIKNCTAIATDFNDKNTTLLQNLTDYIPWLIR